MLAARNVLMSNLNYVHLQHVSLGAHLCRKAEGTDTGVTDVSGCYHHQWKDNLDTTVVDANSNDPSVPCRCCDYGSHHQDDCLSPFSPFSPSTDSSSSSDFTLDDSPVSMYYQEYSQNGLGSPEEPNIIPLDGDHSPNPTLIVDPNPTLSVDPNPTLIVDPNPTLSVDPNPTLRVDPNTTVSVDPNPTLSVDPNTTLSVDPNTTLSVDPNPTLRVDPNTTLSVDPNPTLSVDPNPTLSVDPNPTLSVDPNAAEHNNNTQIPDGLHWDAGPVLDSNCNTLASEGIPESSVIETGTHPNTGDPTDRAVDEETPKKTITSFHELAQKRRRSGGTLPSQPKRDRSDWLIVFSPDAEQPPANELTASAFFHPLPAGKEVTTFRELRYRNALNKQGAQPGDKGSQPSVVGHSQPVALRNNPNVSCQEPATIQTEDPPGYETRPHPSRGPKLGVGMEEAPQRGWQLSGHKVSTLVDTLLAMKREHHQPNVQAEPRRGNDRMPETGNVSPMEGVWNRGLADGGDKRCQEVSECVTLMANGDKDSIQRDKKRLLITIGAAVEKIISHFNTSRNQVQKTQLGDSRLSPALGYLILKHLCPSLYLLLADGLKPFQKDVIIGQRRLSPWSVVEACSKTGPNSLQNLFNKVNHLQQLRDPQRRFNAFIYGLLNMKQLDIWVSHLHQSYDQLSSFFFPNGFLPLASSQLELCEELLLTLQPLSALTFHIDLLFEHHHLQLQDVPGPLRSLNQGQIPVSWGLPSLQQLLDIGGWITHNFSGNVEKESMPPEKSPIYTCSSDKGSELKWPFQSRDCPQELPNFGSEILQDESADTPLTMSSPGTVHNDTPQTTSSPGSTHDTPQTTSSPGTAISTNMPSNHRDLSSTWWKHINQASRVYIPPKRDSFSFNTFRKLTNWGSPDSEYKPSGTLKDRDVGEQGHDEKRSYCVDTMSGRETHSEPNDSANNLGDSHEGLRQSFTSAKEKGNWIGQLFGASSSHGQEMVKSRRPSSWLPPNISVWNLLGKTPGSVFPEPEDPRPEPDETAERTLRALCDHSAAAETQLSFKKGDVLQLVGTVDDDWVRCRYGGHTGLVPVGYTSLIL